MVFISYSNADGLGAGDLKDELEANDYPCFLAHDDIEATDDWHEEIWKELNDCHAFIGLVTEAFNFSAFCQQEIGAALALAKPSVLVFGGSRKVSVPGFTARFQAIKKSKLLKALNELPKFRQLRAESWIQVTKGVDSFKKANAAYSHFYREWETMNDDEKLRWILAAASNRQVYDEGYIVGPFYKKMHRAMRPLLTHAWLYKNDEKGVLHDIESNPVRLKE